MDVPLDSDGQEFAGRNCVSCFDEDPRVRVGAGSRSPGNPFGSIGAEADPEIAGGDRQGQLRWDGPGESGGDPAGDLRGALTGFRLDGGPVAGKRRHAAQGQGGDGEENQGTAAAGGPRRSCFVRDAGESPPANPRPKAGEPGTGRFVALVVGMAWPSFVAHPCRRRQGNCQEM